MSFKVISSFGLLALAACAAANEPYVVGAVGPWKQGYGLQNLQGVQLAEEEINKAGGIDGHAFRVITRDDAGDGPQAAKIAQEFVRNRKISAVIGHVNSSGMLSAAPIYDGQLAAVATSATSPDLSGISSWVFRVISSDSLNGIALANFASRFGQRGPTSVAVLYENNTYGRGLADSFRRSFHGEIVSLDPINADLPTAEPYISYLKSRKPKIVFVAGRVSSGLKILQEAQASGLQPDLRRRRRMAGNYGRHRDIRGNLHWHVVHAGRSVSARAHLRCRIQEEIQHRCPTPTRRSRTMRPI